MNCWRSVPLTEECLLVTTRLWETFCFYHFFFTGNFRLVLELWAEMWIYFLQCSCFSQLWSTVYRFHSLHIKCLDSVIRVMHQVDDAVSWLENLLSSNSFQAETTKKSSHVFHVTLRSKDDRRGQNHPWVSEHTVYLVCLFNNPWKDDRIKCYRTVHPSFIVACALT